MPERFFAKRGSTWLVALFFITLTVLGLLTSADYGQPWDEPWEQDILRLNGNQYAQYLGIQSRMALTSSMPGPESGLIADSVERDHGQSAYYPLLWLVAATNLTPMTRMVIWHGYTWLLWMGGAAALWLICRRLGLSRLLSCGATLLLALTPRMFAEGHYNNKDIVLLALVLVTLWLGLRLMQRPTVCRALLFSLAGAAATNTKIIGLPVWGLCALFVLARQLVGRQMNRRAWLAAVVALVSFGAFYALLTPAMWAKPLDYLRYVVASAMDFTRWQNYVLFRGTVFHLKQTPLPRYYLPYMILVTTPLWIVALLALGQICALKRICAKHAHPWRDDTAMALLLCTLLWLVPLAYAVLGRPTVYNGWRHFYFLYAPMLVLAAYGLRCAAYKLRACKSPWPKRAGAAALALCMGFTGTQMALSHPNEFTYYNALVQGKNLPEYLELDYWNVSTLQTLRALLEHLPQGQVSKIAASDYWSQNGLEAAVALLPEGERARLRVLPACSIGVDYLLANRTYAVLGYWQAGAYWTPLVQTQSFGQPICTVYQRAAQP